ncbi:MAG: HslU--HslV peptidase proteolytic subunit, partial [Alphaproteobacteria bacterium HGW-Alphaproteobacteria-13]
LAEYEKDPEVLAKKAMEVAADICVYTNDQFTSETIEIRG